MAAVAPPPRNNNHGNNPSLGSPSFFIGAPFTQVYTIGTVVTFFVARHYNKSNASSLGGMRWWLTPWTFATPSELLIGGMWILYGARQLEREMSPRRVSVWCAWILTSSVACHALAVPYWQVLFNNGERINNSQYHGIGPYAVMGALFYYFHRYTPRITPNFVSVLGFSFSDKALHYLWFLQAAGGGGWSGVAMVAVGYVSSALYDKFLIHVLDVPDAVARLVGGLVSQLIADGPPRTILPGRPSMAHGGGAAPRRQAAAPPPLPPQPVAPDESAIEQLTMMGFPRARVVEALQACNNDVQRAANLLLTQS
eukprot:scaffold44515_cov191-Amphora_coffeaeformis.AAC.1